MQKNDNTPFKQRNMKVVGPILESFFTSLPFISVIETGSVVVVLYETVRKFLPSWVSLLDFIGFMVFWALLIMLGTYLFVLKPLWTYRGRQMTGINEKLDTVTKQLADVTERLDKMTAEKDKTQ
jgi:hypothetical protein